MSVCLYYGCASAHTAMLPSGWYSPEEGCAARQRPADPTPCTFTSITPAWNNDNLGEVLICFSYMFSYGT